MFVTLAQLRADIRVAGRWTPDRKLSLVREINAGRITRAAACAEFDLSAEELASWVGRFERHGRTGLSVLRLQAVR